MKKALNTIYKIGDVAGYLATATLVGEGVRNIVNGNYDVGAIEISSGLYVGFKTVMSKIERRDFDNFRASVENFQKEVCQFSGVEKVVND